MRKYLIVLVVFMAMAALIGCSDGDALLLKPDLNGAAGGPISITRAEPQAQAPGGTIVLYGKGFNVATDEVIFREEPITPVDTVADAEAEAEAEAAGSDGTKAVTASQTAAVEEKISFDIPERAEDGDVWVFVERGGVKSTRVKVTVDSSLKVEAPAPAPAEAPADPAANPEPPATGEDEAAADPAEDTGADSEDGATAGTVDLTPHVTFTLIDRNEQIKKMFALYCRFHQCAH